MENDYLFPGTIDMFFTG